MTTCPLPGHAGEHHVLAVRFEIGIAGLNLLTVTYLCFETACGGCYRERKEGERQQLADLVGKNLTYISQLEGLDFKLYQACPPAQHACGLADMLAMQAIRSMRQ